ncbi:MAG: hypothetical protein AAF627_15200 [Myxococcota bacterium]
MRALTLALFGLLLSTPAQAQIEVRGPLEGYIQLGGRFQSAESLLGTGGRTIETADIDVATVQLYGELGLIDRWLMLTLEGELFRRNAITNQGAGFGGAASGLGDLRIGAFTTLLQGPINILGSVKFGLPTGDARPETGLPDNDENFNLNLAIDQLPTGDEEFDVEFGLTFAQAVELNDLPFRLYGRAFTAFWLRTGTAEPSRFALSDETDFSNAFNYELQLGVQGKAPILRRLWLIGAVRGSESFADLSEQAGGISIGLGNGVSFTDLSAQVQARLPAGFGVQAEVSGPVRGTLVLNTLSFGIGASYQF